MNSRFPRMEDVFDGARQLPIGDRRNEYLDAACRDNAALRREVEQLLQAASAAEAFFEEGRAAVDETVAPLRHPPGRADGPGEAGADEVLGAQIGRYRLVEKLGEGGCGVVYLAEQEEPVRRRVALKIIRLGMETRSVVARFEAERQALAMMDHPNIARVFDAGATAGGSPYFIMELVRGIPVTTYADQNCLSMRQRLDLFVQVCHAIQHAHQKGIVHGDIKPSNILVAPYDGRPVPKVIDFGISRATEARLTDKRLFSAYAQLMGTPAYMSPEQAELGGVDIDTRSDIYSLGVLLFELLTGRTPFTSEGLLTSGLETLRRTLRERTPDRPSQTFAALDEDNRRRVAQSRCVSPEQLQTLLRGDLDWIVAKSLQKDRALRYGTANGLAMDVERHLDHEPVLARPATWSYRMAKLFRRNRAAFISAAAVATALVAGFGTSTYLFVKEREARHRAVAAEQQQVRLRFEAEQRQRMTQAALLVSQERFEEADALLSDITLSQSTLEGAAVYRAVGEWHALQGRWRQAAERFSTLTEINLLESSDVATMDALRCGPAHLELGDVAAYERFRDSAIRRFSAQAHPFADRILKVSLLRPASPVMLGTLEALMASTADAVQLAEDSGDAFAAAWRSLGLSLLEYRRGHYADALRWSRRCLEYPNVNAPRMGAARVIAAMALFQLGRADEAQREIEAVRAEIEERMRLGLDRGSPVHGFWFDWTFARLLQREASALIAPVR